jgi:hypothetical protein
MANLTWQYICDDVTLQEIDERLGYWGSLGWELVTILPIEHLNESPVGESGVRKRWKLVFKQAGVAKKT